MSGLIPKTWRCDVCSLPDPYNGGAPDWSALCTCPTEDDLADEFWDDLADEPDISAVRPGETPRPVTTTHLPGDRDA